MPFNGLAKPKILLVADNGGGMDQACLAKIFDPFFTTKAAGQGSKRSTNPIYYLEWQYVSLSLF